MVRPLNARGFTLIETVLVLALLAALIYLGSFSLFGLSHKYRLETAVWNVRAALSSARAGSILDGFSYRVRFREDHIFLDRFSEEEGIWLAVSTTWIEGAAIEANNSPVFTPEGTVANLATVKVTNDWGGYKLTLAITGRIKTVRLSS
jgi:prepilin-type N-terminal cleavage/methylation domain-containing protein